MVPQGGQNQVPDPLAGPDRELENSPPAACLRTPKGPAAGASFLCRTPPGALRSLNFSDFGKGRKTDGKGIKPGPPRPKVRQRGAPFHARRQASRPFFRRPLSLHWRPPLRGCIVRRLFQREPEPHRRRALCWVGDISAAARRLVPPNWGKLGRTIKDWTGNGTGTLEGLAGAAGAAAAGLTVGMCSSPSSAACGLLCAPEGP